MLNNKLQVGSWSNLPHYSVNGTAVELYVWINEDNHGRRSRWIRGREAFDLWHCFNKLQAKKDRAGFISLIKEVEFKYKAK